MKRVIVGGLACLGGMVVLLVILIVGLSGLLWQQSGTVPARTILEVDLTHELHEQVIDDPVTGLLMGRALTVRDVVEALHRAALDERVVALIARVGTGNAGLAQIQEVRDAVLAFREKGKRAVAYASTFGEFSAGNGAYYLATAFDTIYLQPAGDVGLTGLLAETPFVRGTLDKLDLVPRMGHRHEYKNFLNTFTERQYTAPHREATQRVLESQFSQIVQGIATARGLYAGAVRPLIDRGPFPATDALQAQLVDVLAYRDEVYAQVKAQAEPQAKLLYLSRYLAYAGRPHRTGDTIALIYGVGAVRLGSSEYDPLMGGVSMGSDTVTAAFRAAIDDPTVKAILFRVDSPGGSYVASDAIWRETLRAREAGKPVIVSMGDVAGSGGYFVAAAAEKIVAHPGTITGSIGVLGGKMLTTGLWDKLGLSWDEVHTSTNATLWSSTRDYTPEQWARIQAWLDRVYEDFTAKVAAGRRLSKEQVLDIAKGRIWTGEDAKERGLVDALGGFPLAMQLIREAIGRPADAPLHLKVFPEHASPWEAVLARLLGEGDESSEAAEIRTGIPRTLRLLRPVLHLAHTLGLTEQPEVLTMPTLRPR
ncbi:MAG: signal peptide peptidase SppA [Candidatus Tectomicrobia bacterium]|uniref:Signal peptide peptidase SppA n=1 Tax=Tectimicrobiota bacterium TaxID=2528274 RepID=A0A937W7F4_UNCTE|nr:signal peptide peptidase SppA [Candidatus Tectomicrobia bacterium]